MKKYDAKYFGIAVGVLAQILYLLIILKMLTVAEDTSNFILPFIPFFTSLSLLNFLGGLVLSFLWGWVIGFFFIIIYNYFDKLFMKISSS